MQQQGKHMGKLAVVLSAAVFLFASMTEVCATQYVTIGTGGVTGVYYPTGGAIAKMVNKKRKENNLRAVVEPTSGSVFNVNAVMTGDLDFGVVQSDIQYQALNGAAEWKGTPQTNLRAVFSIHPETITLVAAMDSGITSVADLRGRRVNIGEEGSGQRGNALALLKAAGIDYKTDLTAVGIRADESAAMLQKGRIEAFFYTVGHPNGSIREAVAGKRKVRFVPIDNEIVDKLVAKSPYYTPEVIPVATYPGVVNQEDVPTFGVVATLVTSTDVSADVVYIITKAVFENFDEFKKLHPAYSTLSRKSMLQGLSAPLHPGAIKYYKEVGLQ
ncbi:MAG: TAXI family TRAP transporter solute-binding subunit [Desulfuromonadales bacterium]